jgi:hypothetical protein
MSRDNGRQMVEQFTTIRDQIDRHRMALFRFPGKKIDAGEHIGKGTQDGHDGKNHQPVMRK